jgi:hypothetical protein
MKFRAILFQLLLYVGFIVSCNSQTLTDSSETSPPLDTEIKPTKTLTPTNTLIPTATQTPTLAATWTPLPTLSEEDRIDIIRILIETNGWCRFPCWWGITPGETTWQEAKQFLGTFSNKIYEDEEYQQEIQDEITYLIGFHEINFQVPNEDRETYILFTEKDGVVVEIGVPQLYQESEFYPTYRILQEYGKPDEVFLHTHPSYGFDWMIALNLVYQEKSFAATYWIFNAVNQDGIIKGCFGKDGATFGLYPSEKTIKIEDMYNLDPSVTIIVLGLEEATGMDVQSFYETYSNPEDPLCLETPKDLWRK